MEKFIIQSDQLSQIVKSLNALKALFVSSLIVGEEGVGKKSLAKYILPNAKIIDGSIDDKQIANQIQESDEIIIHNFEKVTNHNLLNFENKRVIATISHMPANDNVLNLFGFIYELPPLRERKEDALAIANIFLEKAKKSLMIQNKVSIQDIELDLSKNSISIQKSIFSHLLLADLDANSIEEIMYKYFLKNLKGKNGYKEHLYLYEKPLMLAGLKKYGSQLKLAEVLGINRNTLRKKVNELGIN